MVTCSYCDKSFCNISTLNRHMRVVHIQQNCKQCPRIFFGKTALDKHMEVSHGGEKPLGCENCLKRYVNKRNLTRHTQSCTTPSTSSSGAGVKRSYTLENPTIMRAKTRKADKQYDVQVIQTAFRDATRTFRVEYKKDMEEKDIINCLEASIYAMKHELQQYQSKHHALKFNMALQLLFVKATDPDEVTPAPVCLVTEQFEVYADTNVMSQLVKAKKALLNQIDTFERNGSGWILQKLLCLDTTVWKLDPLRASS